MAAVMLFYGWPKIRDLKSNANDFLQMGFNPGIFWRWGNNDPEKATCDDKRKPASWTAG